MMKSKKLGSTDIPFVKPDEEKKPMIIMIPNKSMILGKIIGNIIMFTIIILVLSLCVLVIIGAIKVFSFAWSWI